MAPSVLIVDDDPDMCFLLRMIFKVAGQAFTLAGEVPSGEEALRWWRANQPDVVVIDDGLPGCRALDVARAILAEQPNQAIVLLTRPGDEADARAALAMGVRACVPKVGVQRLPVEVLACTS